MLWPTLLAHAAPINYKFPLPIWLYVVAGGAAVLLSAPAAALGVRLDPRERLTRNIYPFFRPLHLRALVLAALSVLFVWGFVGGFGAGTAQAHEFFENPLTVLAWVDFWVGLGLLATFVGNVWDFVSPLNALARTLDRALARRGTPQRLYPAAVGRWPAVVGILVWSWMELIWPPAKNPPVLAGILAGYIGLTLVGTAVFGSEAWLGNVELFTVFSRTFARFAPLVFTPAEPEEWLAAAPEEREVRLRPFGAGIRTESPLPAGGGAFVITLLATVVDDGFSQTRYFGQFGTWMITHSGFFAAHVQILVTLILLTIAAIFICAYLLVCALMSGGRDIAETVRAYAPTLVPIAAVYFVAHYFTYLLIAGQATLGTLVDPWGHSWNPWGLGEYAIQKGFLLPAAVWWTEVIIIVWGHVVAVIEAHRVGLAREVRSQRALALQLPLVALMVAYTTAGLYVLALQIKGG